MSNANNGLSYEQVTTCYGVEFIVRLNGNVYAIVGEEKVARAMCEATNLREARRIESAYLNYMPLITFGGAS